MAATLTLLRRPLGQQAVTMTYWLITLSGDYPAGGEPCDFLAAVGPTVKGTQPIYVHVYGISGFVYQWLPTPKKLMVYCNTAGGADAPLGELTAGAYPAGVSSDVIRAKVDFQN